MIDIPFLRYIKENKAITDQELADKMGVCTRTVGRMIREFKNEKVISCEVHKKYFGAWENVRYMEVLDTSNKYINRLGGIEVIEEENFPEPTPEEIEEHERVKRLILGMTIPDVKLIYNRPNQALYDEENRIWEEQERKEAELMKLEEERLERETQEMEVQKIQNVSKCVKTCKNGLNEVVLNTMSTISDVVGSTLGPGGKQVLIERPENDLPPIVTKDGVTVFRSLGFENPIAQTVMESARDSAIKTGNEAGDGTTTATILAESIVREINSFCKKYRKYSPQKVVRHLQSIFKNKIEPYIKATSRKIDIETEEGKKLLEAVATISANGDYELASSVMECFNIVGDDGNVTITELLGPSSYQVERIEGYPVGIGYEDCCHKFYPKFINDQHNQKVCLDKPVFLVYHGKITEFQTLMPILNKIGENWQENKGPHNVVVMATGFSESVVNALALNFPEPNTLNVFPLLVPLIPFPNGQLYLLQDVAAITNAVILDSISNPLETADLDVLGDGCLFFESGRFRSNIISKEDDILDESKLLRVEELKSQLGNASSEMEKSYLQERIGKLTGGIARLKIYGSSNGETKEKRDRAEDAVCAVRGAIKHGCLPGGGWTLIQIIQNLLIEEDDSPDFVLSSALKEPFRRLLENAGYCSVEIENVYSLIDEDNTYDLTEGSIVPIWKTGLVDSTPAVLEAIRNAISISSLLGTLGGAVVFNRNKALELSEASSMAEWNKDDNPTSVNLDI